MKNLREFRRHQEIQKRLWLPVKKANRLNDGQDASTLQTAREIPSVTVRTTSPFGPVIPGAPLSPLSPLRPCSPGNPCKPGGPVYPCGPTGPGWPCRNNTRSVSTIHNHAWAFSTMLLLKLHSSFLKSYNLQRTLHVNHCLLPREPQSDSWLTKKP